MNKIGQFMIGLSMFTLSLAIITWFGYLKVDKYNQKNKIVNYIGSIDDMENSEYYGYINFPKYEIERLIKKGPAERVIEEGYIGIYGYTSESDLINPLVLVGHSRSNLFSVLHQLTIHDQIEIHIGIYIHKYQVKKMIIIDVDNYHVLNTIKNNQLGLITCLEDNSKRLLVIGEEL